MKEFIVVIKLKTIFNHALGMCDSNLIVIWGDLSQAHVLQSNN